MTAGKWKNISRQMKIVWLKEHGLDIAGSPVSNRNSRAVIYKVKFSLVNHHAKYIITYVFYNYQNFH